jgi:hypothetical protein
MLSRLTLRPRAMRIYPVKIWSVLNGGRDMGISGHSWLMPHADRRYIGQRQVGRSR